MENVQVLGKRTISDQNGEKVNISIYQPIVDEHGSFFCEFFLDGLSWNGKKRRTYGIDAIQAIYLALQSIGSDLQALQEDGSHNLSWIGESCVGDLGLPTIIFMPGDSSAE